MENRIFSTMAAIAECLCAQIIEDGGDEPCFCGVVPGDAAIGSYALDCDGGKCGMAWVRLVTAYPSNSVGQISQQIGNCTISTGFDIEVGIMRCITIEEEAPTEAELLGAVDRQISDMLTMKKAMNCCPELNPRDFVLGVYQPIGPTGGYVGGTWNVTLGL